MPPTRSKLAGNPRAVRWPSPAVLKWVRDRVVAAGGDPDQVPDMPFRFLPLAAVKELTGLSTSTLYRMQAAGEFPRAVPVDRASVRGVGCA
jgi:predicted DNA-binding transcriptional regulator AlpA